MFWPHLLEIPPWEAPPTHSPLRCQHVPECGLPDWLFYGNNPIHHTYHIRNRNCFFGSPQCMNIFGVGGAFVRRSNWFFPMHMSHYQMRLTLVGRFEVLSEGLFVPSSFVAHLIDRLTCFFCLIYLFIFPKNLPRGMQCARLMSYLLGPALVRFKLR